MLFLQFGKFNPHLYLYGCIHLNSFTDFLSSMRDFCCSVVEIAIGVKGSGAFYWQKIADLIWNLGRRLAVTS